MNERCHTHQFDTATAACRDCKRPYCQACCISVPRLGTFCVPCALRRSGVRPGRRR